MTSDNADPLSRLMIAPMKASLFRPKIGHHSRVFAAIFERPAGVRSIRLKQAYGWPSADGTVAPLASWRCPHSVRRPKPNGFMICPKQRKHPFQRKRGLGLDEDVFVDPAFYGRMWHPNFVYLGPSGIFHPHDLFHKSDLFVATPNLVAHFMFTEDGATLCLPLDATKASNEHPSLPGETLIVPTYLRADRPFPTSNHERLEMAQFLALDIKFLREFASNSHRQLNAVPLWDNRPQAGRLR